MKTTPARPRPARSRRVPTRPAFTLTTLALASLQAAGQVPTSRGSIPALPKPPFLERYFLEAPLIPVGLLLLAALAVFILMNQQGRARRGALIAAGLAVLAAAVGLTARSVTTTREALRARTFELIAAVVRVDIPKLEQILDPDAVAYFSEAPGDPGRPGGSSGVRILTWITPALSSQYRVREWAVLDQQASIDGPGIARTQFRVRVTAEDYGMPYLGWVRFNWRKDASGAWRVRSVEEIARGIN